MNSLFTVYAAAGNLFLTNFTRADIDSNVMDRAVPSNYNGQVIEHHVPGIFIPEPKGPSPYQKNRHAWDHAQRNYERAQEARLKHLR